HVGLHARVRDNEPTLVEDVVADEAIQELLDIRTERRALLVEFRQREVQSVRDGHVTTLELALQLDVVIARHTKSAACLRHRHHRLQRVDDARAAIDKVTDENRPSTSGMYPRTVVISRVTQLLQQLLELPAAPMNVTDDVERAGLAFAVV